jgi:hypothetical protein
MSELSTLLTESQQMIQEQQQQEIVQSALQHLRKTLISGKTILTKALTTQFRRSTKFKSPIRILINDVLIGMSKLGTSLSLAYAKPLQTSTPAIAKGLEECVLADKYFYGHATAIDYAKALQWYTASVALLYTPAMCALANMYREGIGVPGGRSTANTQHAIELYKRAAALGNLDAVNQLGIMHEAGEGVPKNLEIAIELV